jgi:hypothetical protein
MNTFQLTSVYAKYRHPTPSLLRQGFPALIRHSVYTLTNHFAELRTKDTVPFIMVSFHGQCAQQRVIAAVPTRMSSGIFLCH